MGQQEGCYALSVFAAGNAENQSRIREAGGIEVVVDALRAHPTSAAVQRWGCYARDNLAAGSFLHPARKGLWITCFFLITLYLYYTKNYIFTSWFWMVVIVFFHFILCEHFQSAISPSALWFIFSSFSSLFFYFDSELTPTLVTTSVLILSLWYGKGNLLNLRRSSS